MPTPPAVPNVCRWRLLGTLANLAPWGIRFYTAYTGATPTSAAMLALAEDIASSWNTTCATHQSNTVTLTQCDGVDLSSDLGASATADVDTVGGADEAAVDNQIALIIKMEIARRYRGGKPKMYVPGIGVSGVADDSHFSTSMANAMGTQASEFNLAISGLSSGGTNLQGLVNVSFYEGFSSVQNPITHRWRNVPTYRAVALVDPVESFTADELMGSQKRRRVG